MISNSPDQSRKTICIDQKEYLFYDLKALESPKYDSLPISIRYLLEAAVRNCDGFHVCQRDVQAILDWENTQAKAEVPFCPARVLLQDFTGVPAVVDLASMRDAVRALGDDPMKINPICPVDLVIDHSVQVDSFGKLNSIQMNQQLEFERNIERFRFLKWGAHAFENLLIVPPGSGIVHQVNLEYLARVVSVQEQGNGQPALLYPDSVVGTDSHTTMIDGLGVLGWGVGGIEAEAVMLGQPISMLLPEVIGYKMTGKLPDCATSTDLVLTITKHLRSHGVVGKFVEFFGSGIAHLSIADRATIANMCPEYGATVGFFPVDVRAIQYLQQTGRDEHTLHRIEQYLKANKMFVDYSQTDNQHPKYTEILHLDLSSIVPCVSGPKRPHDQVPLSSLHNEFRAGLTAPISFKGYGLANEQVAKKRVELHIGEEVCTIGHGSVVISAITSCTNTSNPSVMLGAGLIARKAIRLGLRVPPYVKTSLSPGSGVVTRYLEASGLLPDLEKLGYFVVGYGCMTCIGNSGPLDEAVAKAIEENDLVVAGVLSGNRNFEGRIHPHVRANYLASPMLVIIYGLAGRVDIDLEVEPIGISSNGKPVFFRDIWPSHQEIADFEQRFVLPQFFRDVYANIQLGSPEWQALECPDGPLYPWEAKSTYIKRVPFFDDMKAVLDEHAVEAQDASIRGAFALLNLGDSVTTDHISPAGSIARNSPAARWLMERGVDPRQFNTYGARRGHDEVMARGTFANIRLVNKLASRTGPFTVHIPSAEQMDIFEAAELYKREKQPIIVLAGAEYGSGSSRDWAAKGPLLQGVRAVLAKSFERIHRSNLIGMGILPLQFQGQDADTLGITGRERFDIEIPRGHQGLKPGAQQLLEVKVFDVRNDQQQLLQSFQVLCRLDTEAELAYWRHGGILTYMIRKLIGTTTH